MPSESGAPTRGALTGGRVAADAGCLVLGPGGAERVVATLANAWVRRRCAVTLLTLDDGAQLPFHPLDPAIRHVPLAVTAVSRRRIEGLARNLGRIRVLRRAIRASRPDAVLSFTDSTNVLTLCAARFTRWPVVTSEHSDPERHPLPSVWKRLMLVSYRWAAAIVTPNRETRDGFPPTCEHARMSFRTRFPGVPPRLAWTRGVAVAWSSASADCRKRRVTID